MEREIINRVSNSPLISLDLEEYYSLNERVVIDMKDWLYQGLIIKEKDFRERIKSYDWSEFSDKSVAITCTTDAIVPTWAYMLMAINLEPVAHTVVFGGLKELENSLFQEALSKINGKDYSEAKVVIKGCSKLPVPEYAYVEITRKLRPFVSSIMYGEPCSTVPLYKAPKKKR